MTVPEPVRSLLRRGLHVVFPVAVPAAGMVGCHGLTGGRGTELSGVGFQDVRFAVRDGVVRERDAECEVRGSVQLFMAGSEGMGGFCGRPLVPSCPTVVRGMVGVPGMALLGGGWLKCLP